MTPTRSSDGVLSFNGALVLQAIVQGHRYGFEIMRAAHLPSGTVYPLLRRMEAAEMVESEWEETLAARDEGRPPRRNYVVTAEGRAALAEARERVMAQQALFAGGPAPSGRGG